MRVGLVRRVGRVCAAEATGGSSRMVNRVGGGIIALRRPRPYSRAFAGMALRGIAAPTTIYAHGHQWDGVKADHDAACRVVFYPSRRFPLA